MGTAISFRCYCFREGDQWIARCVDLCLAVQSGNLVLAIKRLSDQVDTYVCDLWEEDASYVDTLLDRKAPFTSWLHYYWLRLLNPLGMTSPMSRILFFTVAAPFNKEGAWIHAEDSRVFIKSDTLYPD